MIKSLLFCCMLGMLSCWNLPDYSKIGTSTEFLAGVQCGTIQGNFVKELSGIAPGRLNREAYWVHGDGSITEIYLIDSLGNRLATLPLPPNTPTADCEDIATGWLDGKAYIFLADLGDNDNKYDTHRIYCIPEPIVPAASRPAMLPVPMDMQTIVFAYPKNGRFNAESLLFDPIGKSFYIATKGSVSHVFSLPANPGASAGTQTPQEVAQLPIYRATAGDISSDGQDLMIKNKQAIFYWKIPKGIPIGKMLSNSLPQQTLYSPETQGEAICFNAGNTGYLTSTERAHHSEQAIWFYKRK